MAAKLGKLGVVLLAAAAWLVLSGAMGWLPEAASDRYGILFAKLGVVALGGSLALAVLAPLVRGLRRTRCARCGTAIERGQTYCNDHLQQAVNQYRDQGRDRRS